LFWVRILAQIWRNLIDFFFLRLGIWVWATWGLEYLDKILCGLDSKFVELTMFISVTLLHNSFTSLVVLFFWSVIAGFIMKFFY